MRPLRVLHVAPYFADAWAYGGIPRIVGALARGLAERGHDVTVCATDACSGPARLQRPPRTTREAEPGRRTAEGGADGGDVRRPWPPSSTPAGVVVRIFPNLSNRLAYRQLFTPLGLGKYLEQSARDFDVAHLHACRNLTGAIAARSLRRAGIPYVLAPNGTALRIESRRLAKRAFDLAVGSRVVRGASRFIAVSEAECVQLRSMGVPPGAIRLVPNPIDLEEFQAPIVRGRFRRRVGASGPMVLFLGRMTARKRLDVLVRAFARLDGQAGVGAPPPPEDPAAARHDVVHQRPLDAGHDVAQYVLRDARHDVGDVERAEPIDWSQARLVIAGNDAGAGRAARRLAASVGIFERTVFAGLLCGAERLEALADADVVVYPSQDEIFGLVPLEALLAGTPVVVADDSGCGAIVRAVGGGTVVPLGDAAALAAAISDMVLRPACWRASAAAAAGRVRAAYASAVVCAQLERVYRELAEPS